MVAARGHKRRVFPVALNQFEAKHAAIKAKGTLQIRYLQVDMPDTGAGIDRSGSQCVVHRFRFPFPEFTAGAPEGNEILHLPDTTRIV